MRRAFDPHDGGRRGVVRSRDRDGSRSGDIRRRPLPTGCRRRRPCVARRSARPAGRRVVANWRRASPQCRSAAVRCRVVGAHRARRVSAAEWRLCRGFGSMTSPVGELARVESLRLWRNPLVWLAIVPVVLWARAERQAGEAEGRLFLLIGYGVLLPGLVMCMVMTFAVLRGRLEHTEELLVSAPVGNDRRTLGHVV